MEIWKDINSDILNGSYEISNFGNIRNLKTKKVRKLRTRKNGYQSLRIRNKDFLIHRLVLNTFNPISQNLHCNHINGIKNDNRLENLEWVTRSENINHAYYVLGKGVTKINAYKDNKFIATFSSISEAAKKLNCNAGSISKVVNGLMHQTNGYKFIKEL